MKSEQKSTDHSRAGKRAQFNHGGGHAARSRLLPKLVAGATFLLLLVTGFRMFSGRGEDPRSLREPSFKEVARAEFINIPVAEVDNGKAKFYSYKAANGREVKFFVMKSSDGVYRAALDSCDECYRAKKGYVQVGDQMVCRKCGQSFPSALINEVSGGCNPVPVERTITDGKLIIAARTLESGAAYF